MAAANNKYTPFTATTVPSSPVAQNQARRGLRIQIYGPPDVASPSPTVWYNTTGNMAVAFQCRQGVAGSEYSWGSLADREFQHTPGWSLANCPTGAISVVTNAGSAQGLIEEQF